MDWPVFALLGLSLAAWAYFGWRSGVLTVRGWRADRRHEPRMFWFHLSAIGAASTFLLILAATLACRSLFSN